MPGTSPVADILGCLVVDTGMAPGGTAAVAAYRDDAWQLTLGAAGMLGVSVARPVTNDTVYDLASVTKPIIALTLARLVAAGHLSFEAPLGDLLDEARGTPTEHSSLESLLSHRAGLDAHAPLFAPLCRGQALDRALALKIAANSRRAECEVPPAAGDFPPLYSDLGYLLLGEAISRHFGVPLDELVENEINQHLGTQLRSVRQWRKDPSFMSRVAPSEVVEWRGGEIRGQIHDENAFALAGEGTAGNAGLFATAQDVAVLGMRVLDALRGRDTSWLKKQTLNVLIRSRPGGVLRAGFDGKSDIGSSAGQLFGSQSFGHLGFTGTSFWCDPDAQIVAVVLTNRVNPSRENLIHKQFRPLLHDALFRTTMITP